MEAHLPVPAYLACYQGSARTSAPSLPLRLRHDPSDDWSVLWRVQHREERVGELRFMAETGSWHGPTDHIRYSPVSPS